MGRLLRRALSTGDQLAFKLLRNLVWTGGAALAGQLVGGVPEMVALLRVRRWRKGGGWGDEGGHCRCSG